MNREETGSSHGNKIRRPNDLKYNAIMFVIEPNKPCPIQRLDPILLRHLEHKVNLYHEVEFTCWLFKGKKAFYNKPDQT